MDCASRSGGTKILRVLKTRRREKSCLVTLKLHEIPKKFMMAEEATYKVNRERHRTSIDEAIKPPEISKT
ncbi:hypothetical protein NC651_012209 [Populus alba x Populus x berolinensis]|nr:hypothetical protein NC651_012209 [Populus alba x Populus x berolinensis]